MVKDLLVATRSEAWVWDRTLARIAGSNPSGGHGCLSRVLCAVEVEVPASG